MHKYFKITDKRSRAWETYKIYKELEKEARRQLKELEQKYDIEVSKVKLNPNRTINGLMLKRDKNIKGLRKKAGVYYPDRRTKVGKSISAYIKKIRFPSSDDILEIMVGESPMAVDGRMMHSGMGMANGNDVIIATVHHKVWEQAQESDSFKHPDGLIEITHSEYEKLEEQIRKERKAKREANNEDI